MPVALTSISTSPAFGPSSCTVSMVRGLPASNATAALTSMTSTLQNTGLLGDEGCDVVHQRRRETVIGLELQLPQTRAHGAHVGGIRAGLDDRRDESREFRR